MLLLNDFVARMAVIFQRPIGPLNEIKRALTEQTKALADEQFDESFSDPKVAAAVRDLNGPKVDAAILAAKPGPGGGVRADPFRAAFFLIAATMDGPRASAGQDTWRVWHFPHADSVLAGAGRDFEPTFAECALTGCHLFGHAFQSILSSAALARRVDEVRMSTEGDFAEIEFDSNQVSRFKYPYSQGLHFSYKVSVLTGAAVHMIAGLLAFEKEPD